MSRKKRLDILLFERNLTESRQLAQSLIMEGLVYVGGRREQKPGASIPEDADIVVQGGQPKYVSRGGLKLEKALTEFGIDPNGMVALDTGASTGGFTDCLLQNGAKRVYAVDVGYGQLAWKLRIDERVVCMERTNSRYLTAQQIPEPLDLAVIDVSFISLRLILPAVRPLLGAGGQVICLIKPQFEAGREKVGKKGVVRDPAVHLAVLEQFLNHTAESDFSVRRITYSPIRGPEGNIEYLGHLTAGAGVPFSDEYASLPYTAAAELGGAS